MEIKNWSYEDYPEFKEDIEGAVRLATTGCEVGVEYRHDVPYCVKDGHELVLQLLIPFTRNDPEKTYPCIVYVQGSAWMHQNVWSKCGMLARLASRGYVIAIVQYRDSGMAAFPAQIYDAQDAVRFMRINEKEYHANTENIVVAGDSSGGHTAVFCALMQDANDEKSAYPGVSAAVSGVIDLYGAVSLMEEDGFPTTLNHHLADSPEGRLMGNVDLREKRELCKLASAKCQIKAGMALPPMLIFHGTKDRTVNPSASAGLFKRLRECGYDAKLYLLEGADHGGAEFWTESIIDIEDEFIKQNVLHL